VATAAEAAVFVDRCRAVGLPTAGVMAEVPAARCRAVGLPTAGVMADVPAARCAPTRSLAPSTSSASAPTT
jgi:hypothetical protein